MKNLGLLGTYATLACAIHCALMPILVIVFPIISISLFVTEPVEWLLLILSLFLNLSNLCFGYKKHKSLKALGLLGIGTALFVIGKMAHSHYNHEHSLHFDIYTLILISGGILISTSYWINNSLCHSCKTCKIHGCE